MRGTIDKFKINNKPMLAPDAEVAMSFADLDSEESGRDESGYMHRVVVAYKVGTWSFTYSNITDAEKEYIDGLFPNSPDFQFTHPDRTRPGALRVTQCYRSNYSVSWKSAKTGLWKNYSFNIIACEGES